MAKLAKSDTLGVLDATVEMGTSNAAQVGVEVSGTFVGTITFETRVGKTWANAQVFSVAGVGVAATTTAAVTRRIDTGGTNSVRARMSAYTSGEALVQFSGTEAGMGGSGGGGGGGGASTIADGADVAEGSTTDAAVTTDANGTVIGFLRGAIVKWVNFLSRFPAALGSTTAANSLPVTLATDGQFVASTGSLTETAPATDTASSGLNGRLQRIAQRLTSLIAAFPSALVGGRIDVNVGAVPATISAVNSTTANLGNGGVFTGTAEDVSGYASISVIVFANQISAAGGLSFQFSTDGTNWDFTQGVSVALSVAQTFVLAPVAQFFRIVYTNGVTPQTVFRLETIYRPVATVKSGGAFQDINGSLSPTFIGQRMSADIMLQDAIGNTTNRVRSARDMIVGVAGATMFGMGVGVYDGSLFRPWVGGTDGRGKVIAAGVGDVLTATLTRPANVTAYAVGDEMTDTGAAILQFTGMAIANGGGGAITGLLITNSVNAAVKATGELRLYDTTSTPATDNAAFDASDTVNDTLVAVIEFNTASDGLTGTTGNCVYAINERYIRYKCASADTKLYGRVILKSAYTSPANSDTWKFKLRAEIDS